jgi:hypothetical protein
MKVEHIWAIPDQGGLRGGFLYDRFGNLEYFADTTALTDRTSTPVDQQNPVKAHTRSRFMNDPAPHSVQATVQFVTKGQGRPKGALPGATIKLISDAGLPGQEEREFSYTGGLSCFVAWLKTTAKMQVDVYSARGSLVATVPAAAGP